DKLDDFYLKAYPVERYAARLAPASAPAVPELEALGFRRTNLGELGIRPGAEGGQALLRDFAQRIDRYDDTRDVPALDGTSGLGMHLRFGTVSIRRAAALARSRAGSGAATWLKELAWRDFYAQLLANFPSVGEGRSFRPEYDRIAWESGPLAEE